MIRRPWLSAVNVGFILPFVALSVIDPRPLSACPAQAARDSAGIEIVSNPGTDTPLDWRIRKVLRLGDAMGPPETSFFKLNPYSVGAGPGGTILVLNRGNYRVVVFSRDGIVLRAFGRQGAGPGQLRNPVSIWLSPSGAIRVLDFMAGILTFDSEGTLLAQEVPEQGVIGLGMHMEETPAGLVHSWSVGLRSDTLLIEEVRIARGADTTTLARWELRPTKTIRHPTCRLTVQFGPIFEPELIWDANAGHVAVLSDYSYRIDLYGHDGAPVRSIRRDIAPRRTTRDDALRELGPTPGFNFPPDRLCVWDPAELVKERGFYPLLQPIEALALAPDGYLWARRTRPGDDPGPIDVFRPDGTYAGTLPASMPFPDAFIDSSRFLSVETDELDVEHVAVYEVVAE
ncbi:MAG: 6-bladed beta-propeller [Gemmatimonadota bacterium]